MLTQFQTDDRDFQLMQNSWASKLDPLLKSAAAIGTLKSSVVSTSMGLSTGVIKNLTSIDLDPGQWEIWAFIAFGGTITGTRSAISIGTSPTDTGKSYDGSAYETPTVPSAISSLVVQAGPFPVTLQNPTKYFLNCSMTFSGGSPLAQGSLYARLIKTR